MRILVIEDETKVARALKEGLESEHYQVVVARTGEEGFFLVNAETFDLVLLDLMLPGRAGLEILGACRRRPADAGADPDRQGRDRRPRPRAGQRCRRLRGQALRVPGAARADPRALSTGKGGPGSPAQGDGPRDGPGHAHRHARAPGPRSEHAGVRAPGVPAPAPESARVARDGEEADRLARLVDSLLLLSRADAGQATLRTERTDLGRMAHEVATQLEVLAEEKRQTVSTEVVGPVAVAVDRAVLRQAVINLLDNAIKYSPEGAHIRVVVRLRSGAPAIEVTDTGPGIAPEHREAIFNRFYRVDPARSREAGGAGLGLSIARWAVDVHGGHIEVESDEGKGSTFRIVLLPSPGAEAADLRRDPHDS